MRYIKFFGHTQYCGESYEEYVEYEENIPDKELDRIASEMAYENACEWFSPQLDEDDYDLEEEFELAKEEEADCYFAESYGTWEEVTEEEYNEYA